MLCQSFRDRQNDHTHSHERKSTCVIGSIKFCSPAKVTSKVAMVPWGMLSDWAPFNKKQEISVLGYNTKVG